MWEAVRRARLDLADLLDGIEPASWDTPSLCAGWRVREVAAHATFITRVTPASAMVGMLRAGGNVGRWVDGDARRLAARSTESLSRAIRESAESRNLPPGTKDTDPLVDILVHSQDIAIPLGIVVTMPSEAVLAADAVLRMRRFKTTARVRGLALRATNADWARGEGERVEGPIESLLLAMTGRPRGLDGLTGQGLRTLTARF